jgi:hypothetical protein
LFLEDERVEVVGFSCSAVHARQVFASAPKSSCAVNVRRAFGRRPNADGPPPRFNVFVENWFCAFGKLLLCKIGSGGYVLLSGRVPANGKLKNIVYVFVLCFWEIGFMFFGNWFYVSVKLILRF